MIRERMLRVLDWIREQMGADEDSPWREEPEAWDRENLRRWLARTAVRFNAKAAFIFMEGEDGVFTHLVVTNDPESLVVGVARAVRDVADRQGAVMVNIDKPPGESS